MIQQTQPRVVICGAGVIGAAVAYYLSLRGVAATIVERSAVACAASGKAGGFLALDWCENSPLSPLARKSFALHGELAQTLGTDYGYRRLTTLAVAAGAHHLKGAHTMPEELAWLDSTAVPYAVLGTTATTAQVHPAQFTQALVHATCQRGVHVHKGCVEGLHITHGQVHGVRVDGQLLPADVVVIALGPWSCCLTTGLPLPPVWGLKGHSITLRPSTPLPAQALFLDYVTTTGEHLAPEVYPRPDGEVYLCGLSEEVPLPVSPELVQPRPEAGLLLQKIAAELSSSLAGLQPQRVQACYRPVSADGLPFLDPLPEVTGVYLATGHSCWGILNAPASGLAMAELTVDGQAKSIDLAPFAPQRALVAR
jgi:glycine/D-amino acid oxidase-like deaminating enzyme